MGVTNGDRVTLQYVARYENGTVFDTSNEDVARKHDLSRGREYEPLVYTIGSAPMVPSLEEALLGMDVGETKTVRVPHEDFVQEYDREEFEGMVDESVDVGLTVHADSGMIGEVVAVDEETVTVDFDPGRAGQTLEFQFTLADVESGARR